MTTANIFMPGDVKIRDGIWLGLAVLAHALLLLIPPWHASAPASDPRPISVSLLAPDPVTNPPVEAPPEARVAVEPTAAEIEEPRPEPMHPALTDTDPEISVETERDEGIPVLNAAWLFGSLDRLTWEDREVQLERRLGEFTAPTLRDHQRAVFRGEDNLFDDVFLPARAEIIDRWLAADGSRNMVINTSAGETICGRAHAWDPMNPLFEPVVTYWKCGGGGRRTIEMPRRYDHSVYELRAANSALRR